MKIKQLIAGGIACIMTVSSMLVFATDRAVVSAPFINGDNVTISGEIPDCVEETVVTIQVVKPGGSFGNLEHVYYLGETVSESNGEFSHTINISDLNNIGTEGSFYIYAGAETAAHSEITLDSDGQVIQKFDYFLTSTIKSKAREIFDATSVEQIKGILNSAESKSKFKAMGLLIDKYRALDLKDETAEAVLKLKNILEDNDFEAFYSALPETFNSVFVLDVLNGTWSTTTDMLTALDEFKHLITINPDEYIGLGEAEKTFFDSKIKLPNNGKWNSVNDFEKIWDEAMALITINGETDYQNISHL